MKHRVLLLATIDGIKAEGGYEQPSQIVRDFLFTNDSNFLSSLIGNETNSFLKEFGQSTFKSILKSKAFLFVQESFEDLHGLDAFLEKYPADSLIKVFNSRLILFVQFLWLVKDSSAGVGNIYFISPRKLGYSNSNNCFLSCKGETGPVIFQRNEIESAGSMLESHLTLLKKQNPSPPKLASEFQSVFSNDKTRLSKALVMLQVVRQSEDLGLKIAHYCSCFEILFNSPTDKEGISHKLAERMAFFLSASVEERLVVYEDVREAYGVRCGIFHGKFPAPERQDNLKNMCARCDDLLRATLRRIIENTEFAALFTDKGKQFDRHFRDLIFRAYD